MDWVHLVWKLGLETWFPAIVLWHVVVTIQTSDCSQTTPQNHPVSFRINMSPFLASGAPTWSPQPCYKAREHSPWWISPVTICGLIPSGHHHQGTASWHRPWPKEPSAKQGTYVGSTGPWRALNCAPKGSRRVGTGSRVGWAAANAAVMRHCPAHLHFSLQYSTSMLVHVCSHLFVLVYIYICTCIWLCRVWYWGIHAVFGK